MEGTRDLRFCTYQATFPTSWWKLAAYRGGDMLLPEDNSTSVNVSENHNNLQGMLVNSQSIDKSEPFWLRRQHPTWLLQKENEYLKKLIEEKERLIKVLLGDISTPKCKESMLCLQAKGYEKGLIRLPSVTATLRKMETGDSIRLIFRACLRKGCIRRRRDWMLRLAKKSGRVG